MENVFARQGSLVQIVPSKNLIVTLNLMLARILELVKTKNANV